ncbi:MAG: C-terminal domain, partial [Verrucomicrobiota bacterium]
GQTITDQKIGMNGKYPGDAFNGKAGIAGVDFNNPGGNAGQPYRPETGVAAGKGPNGGGRNRGLFDVDVNYTVGWNDAGDWQNYTRTFPTPAKKYSVYGFASSGGSPIQFTLDQVTAGVGTENQTLKPLAELKPGRATAGWDNLELFQFTDLTTKAPVVLELGGKVTLRLTLPAGNGDMDYLAFIPYTAVEEAPKFSGISRNANGSLTLTWTGGGKLQSAPSPKGPWTDVAGAASPFTVTPNADAQFARIVK